MFQVVRRHWDFRFCGFGYFFRSVFRFWCSLRFADIPFSGIWFSVFAKNTNGFPDLIFDAVFGFFLFDRFGFRFLFDLSGNYAPPLPLNANVIERNA